MNNKIGLYDEPIDDSIAAVCEKFSDKSSYIYARVSSELGNRFCDILSDFIIELTYSAYEQGHQDNRDLVRLSMGLDDKTNAELAAMFSERSPDLRKAT